MKNATILSQIQASMMSTINAAAYASARMAGAGVNSISANSQEAAKPLFNVIRCGESKCGTIEHPYEEYCQKR